MDHGFGDLVGNSPGEGVRVAGGIWEGWGGQEEADCPALLSLPIWVPYVVGGPLVVGVEDAAPRGGRGGVAAAALLPGAMIPAIARGAAPP